ncbi:MAG: PAS domain-containing protein [Rubrivivax sp.]|nr:PAS domain-containing protein [Rubrivivax sp.]
MARSAEPGRSLPGARLALHAGIAHSSAAASAVAALGLAWLLRDEVPAAGLAGWLAALAAVLGLRVGLARWHRAAGASTADWLGRYRLVFLLHGLVWGWPGVALAPQLGHGGLDAMVLLLVALAGGALVIGAFDLAASALFAGPVLASLLVGLAASRDDHAAVLGLPTLMFVVVMAIAARRGDRALRALVNAQASAAERTEAARASAAAAEQALRALGQQHDLMQQLLRGTPQGYWFIDAEGRTTDLNPAMCRMLGREREQLLGRPALDLFEGDAREALERELERRRRGEPSTYEIDIERPDGTRVHAMASATPLKDREGRPAGSVGLWTNLTAQKRTEEELQASRAAAEAGAEYLRRTLEATGDAIFASDAEDPRQPVRFVNQQMLQMWGLPPEKARALTPAEIMAAARPLFIDAAAESARVAAIIAGNQAADDRLELRDGRVLRRRCEPARVGQRQVRVWSFRDITAEERALHVLQSTGAEQRALLDAFPGFISAADHELRYTYVNQRLAELWQRPREAIVGHTAAEVLGEERARQIREELAGALGGAAVKVERSYPAGPGRARIDVEVTHVAGPVRPDGSRTCYAFGIDITERNLAREALIAARDDAERANRAKSQFLSHMSHELRTPMNAVVGFAQLLAHNADPPLAPHQQGYVHEMQRAARHLLGLINEVLDLGRIEAGQLVVERAAVPVDELVAECLALVQPLALQRGVRLHTALAAPRRAQAWADRRRLEQVLLNLLGNGVKYNRFGGEVGVDWQLEETSAGAQLVIAVRDTGVGLSAAQRERLFQPFERLGAERGSVEGTGIGLALSLRLVQAMGGDIRVTSTPGAGSTFSVALPAVSTAVAHAVHRAYPAHPAVATHPAQPMAPVAAGLAAARRRVLYIEDNPVNVVVMEAMLGRRPEVRLESAEQPMEGLQRALRDPPDLVLLDIQMPGMDGFEVLARLRAHAATAQVPVLAVSASAMQADRDAALAAGFAEYLTKPVDLAALSDAVRRYVR